MNIKGNSKVKKAEICQKAEHSHPCYIESTIVSSTIWRASLVFILHDVTRFTPLLARLVQ